MVIGGVFERHPRLKLVLTEVAGGWWPATMLELDTSWENYYTVVNRQLPMPPSTYCARNVFVGASFVAPFEIAQAVDANFASNMLWGSDYPHAEGTWAPPTAEIPSMTRVALRHAFSAAEPPTIEGVLGRNACRIYGFDEQKLQRVANNIGAPTIDEVREPLLQTPSHYSLAFRVHGPYA
jgi:predicted TIM-barrel fold metal-dependent hydrolase